MALSITPLSECLGAEVTGIDLSRTATAADVSDMNRALTENLLIVIRNQKLPPEHFLGAVRLFGETMDQHLTDFLMDEHPEIAVLDSRKAPTGSDGRTLPIGSRDWHTDHTNHAHPPKMTALYAVALPASGGDTGFANMHAAYAALPATMQSKLAALNTVNKIEDYSYVSAEHKQKYSAAQVHPLVKIHPVTGKKAIYIHPGKVQKFEGMDPEQSHAVIDDMMERIIQPEITYRHKWRVGDLVLWDNRALLHIAYRDYDPAEGRIMHRVILKEDLPH